MIEDTNCPNCGSNDIYLGNGYNKCENCGKEFLLEFEEVDDNIYLETYNCLVKLKEAFFKLKHGQLYSCIIESEDDKTGKPLLIIPLAWEKNRNRFFILCCFNEKPKEDSEFLVELLKKSFETLKKEGKTGLFPESYKGQPLMCTTDRDGAVFSEVGERLIDFKEV